MNPALGRLVRLLWASPNSVIGMLFVSSALGRHGGLALVGGVLEVHSPFIAWVLRHCTALPGGVAAITFGHVVLGVNRNALRWTRDHERVHVRQYERWGPLFIPAYLLASAWAVVMGAGAYRGNWFEREAFHAERERAF